MIQTWFHILVLPRDGLVAMGEGSDMFRFLFPHYNVG